MKRDLPTTWKTRDGRIILIAHMTDAHLWNTYRMLAGGPALGDAHAAGLAALGYAAGAPDGAAMAAEAAADEAFRADHRNVHRFSDNPHLHALRREMRSRGLWADWLDFTCFPPARAEGAEHFRNYAALLRARGLV